MKYIFTILLISIGLLARAQVKKTLHQTFELSDENTQVELDIFDEFEGVLAENALAIYPSANTGVYTNDFEDPLTNPGYEIEREQFFKTRGSYSELVFSVAGNFDEKIMVGATIGVPFINYKEEKIYEEVDVDSSVIYFDELLFRENLITSGSGINLKLGFIYRINQMFRVGAAIHTPTAFKLTEDYSSQLKYDWIQSYSGQHRSDSA